jgi:hypothetical protein
VSVALKLASSFLHAIVGINGVSLGPV